MKRCQKGEKSLPSTPEHFHRDKNSTDGLYCYCKPCKRGMKRTRNQLDAQYARQYSRYRDLVAYFGNKCERCGGSFPLEVYDWHHPDPTQKRFSPGLMNCSRRWGVLVEEARKCMLVCANCHRILDTEHGTRFYRTTGQLPGWCLKPPSTHLQAPTSDEDSLGGVDQG